MNNQKHSLVEDIFEDKRWDKLMHETIYGEKTKIFDKIKEDYLNETSINPPDVKTKGGNGIHPNPEGSGILPNEL